MFNFSRWRLGVAGCYLVPKLSHKHAPISVLYQMFLRTSEPDFSADQYKLLYLILDLDAKELFSVFNFISNVFTYIFLDLKNLKSVTILLCSRVIEKTIR